MIRLLRQVLLAAVVVVGSGGGVAAADEPSSGSAYSCDALTSASVPAVKKRLSAQGIDVSEVTGPVGLSCRKDAGNQDGVVVSVTGVDGVAFRCAAADEESGTDVVFFVGCG
ncbi:hydrophobin family protein [Actinophytocola sp. KF-1]